MADLDFFVTQRGRQQVYQGISYKGMVQTASFDFSQWAEEEGALTSVTWTVEDGDATIASEALSSSVATAVITTSNEGPSLIKLAATNGTQTTIAFLQILSKNPAVSVYDYGRWL